jgi:hypothetical protein
MKIIEHGQAAARVSKRCFTICGNLPKNIKLLNFISWPKLEFADVTYLKQLK